jgi:H/ACA ribonucleoprotein complex subunit 4
MKQKTIKEILEFGIINIDKPSGMTSFDVSDFVREKLGLRKTSHFGTLDPKVTGVLPIAFNRACKLTGFFIGHNKEYVGIMRLHEELSVTEVQKVIDDKFLGKILQTPPVKSRVKRQEREREVKSFKLLEQNGKDIVFQTEVQGGTYIRKLIDDLGKELGVGAHMLELRRVRAGIFEEDTCWTLYDFEKAVDEYRKERVESEKRLRGMIVPAEEAIKKVYPLVQIKDKDLDKIFTGKPIHSNDLMKAKNFSGKDKFDKGEIVCVFSKERFVGIYEIINEKDIFAKSKFVLQPIT